jgi:hypothetical protein
VVVVVVVSRWECWGGGLLAKGVLFESECFMLNVAPAAGMSAGVPAVCCAAVSEGSRLDFQAPRPVTYPTGYVLSAAVKSMAAARSDGAARPCGML